MLGLCNFQIQKRFNCSCKPFLALLVGGVTKQREFLMNSILNSANHLLVIDKVWMAQPWDDLDGNSKIIDTPCYRPKMNGADCISIVES